MGFYGFPSLKNEYLKILYIFNSSVCWCFHQYVIRTSVVGDTYLDTNGSCGGYHNLSDIIDKSPEVSIISSKQIGVHMINNPILRELADNIASGKDINWQVLWDRVDGRLKGSIPAIYDKWLDYIPPHKNLGAIFIRSYNRLTEEQ